MDQASAMEEERLSSPGHGVPFGEAVRVWAKIAALSFGGPAGQIAVMHRILVDEKRWIGEGRFLHALNYCMLLPGPEAQQLAVYIGWLLHRTLGGPRRRDPVRAAGIRRDHGAELALRRARRGAGGRGAVLRPQGGSAGDRAGSGRAHRPPGAHATGSCSRSPRPPSSRIFFFDVPFPLIILAAGLIGLAGARAGLPAFSAGGGHQRLGETTVADAASALGEATPAHARPALGWSLRVTAVCLLLWLGPVIALLLTLGGDDVFTRIAVFFSKMAVVTFGGAYAVLAYVAQQAVETYGWLEPGEMLDGLGLAETTPGPLIMVVQFVGFMGAYRDPGTLQPMIAGTLGGMLTTWVTFVPCFLWIFLGAPFVEGLRGNRALGGALAAITAAVVGVILNLAIWFALHVLFARGRRDPAVRRRAGRTGAGQPAHRVAPPDRGRCAGGVPLQGRHDPDAGRLCSARRRLPSARRLDLTQATRGSIVMRNFGAGARAGLAGLVLCLAPVCALAQAEQDASYSERDLIHPVHGQHGMVATEEASRDADRAGGVAAGRQRRRCGGHGRLRARRDPAARRQSRRRRFHAGARRRKRRHGRDRLSREGRRQRLSRHVPGRAGRGGSREVALQRPRRGRARYRRRPGAGARALRHDQPGASAGARDPARGAGHRRERGPRRIARWRGRPTGQMAVLDQDLLQGRRRAVSAGRDAGPARPRRVAQADRRARAGGALPRADRPEDRRGGRARGRPPDHR